MLTISRSDFEERLFNPRIDRWDDHFGFDPDTGELHGKTSIGWATVTRLSMNDPVQLLARQLWSDLRLFP